MNLHISLFKIRELLLSRIHQYPNRRVFACVCEISQLIYTYRCCNSNSRFRPGKYQGRLYSLYHLDWDDEGTGLKAGCQPESLPSEVQWFH